MMRYLNKGSILAVEKLAKIACEFSNTFRMQNVILEEVESGTIAVATDGRLLVAKMLDSDDVPEAAKIDQKCFPDWRSALPILNAETRFVTINPVLLMRALKAILQDQDYEHVAKNEHRVVLALPAEKDLPIGICREDGKAIASLMPFLATLSKPSDFSIFRDAIRMFVTKPFKDSTKKKAPKKRP